MANRTPAPAMGTQGTSPAPSPTSYDAQGAKARTTAALCLLLALLTASVTGWFILEGIEATEPASSARWAKVASGILLLILELGAFGLAGQWPEHKKVLRPLGWGILVLEITLMSVSQISIGLTAGKAASHGAGTIEEIRAQAKEARAAAQALRADAASLRASKHGWMKQQAGERSAAAAEQSKNAAAAVASLEKHAAVQVSTPIVEIVGQGGLIALSVALSLALSLSGIVMMHVAGSLWRRASGALPVDQQILELLHELRGTSGAVRAPAAPAPALASFKPVGAVAPAGVPTGVSYRAKAMLAGAGALAAVAPVAVHAHAPAAPAAPVIADTPAPANEGAHAALDTGALASSSPVIVATPAPVIADRPNAPAKARKARVARDGSVMDSGIGPLDGFRYRRAVAGVRAGKIRPSIDGLYEGVGATAPTARRFLAAMASAGVIVPKGRGWTLAQKGGAA